MGVVKYFLVAAFWGCLPVLSLAWADTWVLDHSTLTYTTHHPLKTASGTSKGARGSGQCGNGKCQFLMAAPVKSFESGDSNLDLHMLQVTRGAANPMIVVRSTIDEIGLEKDPVLITLDINFAGKNVTYQNVQFKTVSKGDGSAHIKGTFVIKLNDFAIIAPSLLAMPIKNDVPIDVDAYWKKAGK
jgi:hypothetical protein